MYSSKRVKLAKKQSATTSIKSKAKTNQTTKRSIKSKPCKHRSMPTSSFHQPDTAPPTIPTPLSLGPLSGPKRFFATKPDRSNLKPLDTGIKNLDQLERLHGKGDVLTTKELQLRTQAAELSHQKKKQLQIKASKDGSIHSGQQISNEQIEAQLHEINQAANITPPPTNITHPAHSTYFLPMWDPSFAANKQLTETFERTTNLKIADMDLIGSNVNDIIEKTGNATSTTLRSRLQRRNRVSLVMIASTDATFQFGAVCADLWSREFEKHGISNQDGAIIVQPTLITITEGFLSGLFNSSISRKVGLGLDQHYTRPHTYAFHIKDADGPIARARRYLDCRNRYAANLFLVDERGLIRWKSRTATVPTKEFMETLFGVTNDLILETQYDEAD